MIWLPKKKLVVDTFTANTTAYELFPIDYAIKFVPEWWKNAPKEYEVKNLHPASTIKRCPAIINQYKHGLILPLWSDFAIATRGGTNWEVQFSDPQANIEPHDSRQWDMYADPKEFKHLKLMSPWAMKTKEDVSWTYSKPMWSFPAGDNLVIASGIVEFKTQSSTHINMLMPLAERDPYILQAGQPMAQIIPLTDKDIELRTHLISLDEFKAKYTNRFSYAFTKGHIRTNNIKKQKKCPFQF